MKLLENQPPSHSENDLDFSDVQDIQVYENKNIVGLEALDRFLDTIDDIDVSLFYKLKW